MNDAAHPLTAWARARLEEIEAGVLAMERRLTDASDEAQTRAQLALTDARGWGRQFRNEVDRLRDATAAEIAQSKVILENAWSGFSLSVERWRHAAGEEAVELRRHTQTHMQSVEHLIEEMRNLAQGTTTAAREKAEHALHALELVRESQKAHVDRIEAAAASSAVAWADALSKSRAAFSEALQETRNIFKGPAP